jgi:hypothetical protein
MKIKTRIAAIAASVALAATVAIAAPAPAEAVYGNSVANFSTGWVLVQKDNFQHAWLAGYGSRLNNVRAVIVQKGSCVQVSATRYCAGWSDLYVYLPLAQIIVRRIS